MAAAYTAGKYLVAAIGVLALVLIGTLLAAFVIAERDDRRWRRPGQGPQRRG